MFSNLLTTFFGVFYQKHQIFYDTSFVIISYSKYYKNYDMVQKIIILIILYLLQVSYDLYF